VSPEPNDQETEHQGPIIRDNRRIDPKTYEVREPQHAAAPASEAAEEESPVTEQDYAVEITELTAQLAERTADLQRLQAEYVNYKRRVDRDRDVVRKATIETVIKELLSVLDDLRSAREHGELTGGFKAVGDELERVTGKYGLESFGQAGDPFDPHIHEALLHAHVDDPGTLEGPTCVEILQPGYRIGDRILRPARVAVAEPAPGSTSDAESVDESSRPESVEGQSTTDDVGDP
jgi:molecular chaperone GrpE